MFRFAILLFLLGTAAAEPVIVTVMRGGKPEGDAWVTWDRYGGGFREIHGADDSGIARFEQRRGRVTVFAFHDQFGVVRKEVQVRAGAPCRVTLNLDDARPVKATLWIVDAEAGRAIPGARFKLVRSGDGMERNRPHASKADATHPVLGGCVVPGSVSAAYGELPNLFMRSAHEADAQGRIVVGGLLPGTMDGYVEADGYAPQWIEGVEGQQKVRLTRGGSMAIAVDAPPRELFCRLHREGSFGVPAIIAAELDKQGRFVARNLPQGRYRVSLTSWYPGPRSSSWSDDEPRLGIDAGNIEVVEGKRAVCAVRVGPTHAVALRWDKPELRRVLLRSPRFQFELGSVDPVGAFRFRAVPAGVYELDLCSEYRTEFLGQVVVDAEKGARVPPLARTAIESIEVRLPSAGLVGVWRLGEVEPVPLPSLYPREGFWFRAPRGRYVVRGWLGNRAFSRAIEVHAGETARVTVKAASPDTIPVSVRLLDPDGEPCAGNLELAGYPFRPVEPATRHALRLPVGRYSFVARARGCKTFRGSQTPVDKKRAPVEITIRLEPLRPR